MTIKLIGISGRKRSGKDTIGSFLEREHGFTIDYFAKPLKTAVRDIFHWTKEHTDGDLKEVVDPFWGLSPRVVMQRFGTEVGRQIDADVWAKSLQLRMQQGLGSGHVKYVVTDLRFPNEMAMLRGLGGVVWRVNRPSLGEPGDLHPSETALDYVTDWDAIIVNDGSFEDLYIKVEQALAASKL